MRPPSALQPILVTFIVPCFNEEAALPLFYKRICTLRQTLPGCRLDLVFVDDGSTDGTARVLDEVANRDQEVHVLHLARNVGHQYAVSAGLDFAEGDVLVVIDADLQDPPELVREMLDLIRAGADVVHAQRRRRAGESWFKLVTARLFYTWLRRVSERDVIENSGDFRAFTRPVLEVARAFRENRPFHRSIFANIGFTQKILQYDRSARSAGTTKYSLRQMITLAVNAFLSHSAGPLRSIGWATFGAWMVSMAYLTKALYEHFVLHITVQGWTSLVLLLSFYSGLQLSGIAVLGAYVSRLYEQAQARPRYWVREMRNVAEEEAAPPPPERSLSQRVVAMRSALQTRLQAQSALRSPEQSKP